MENVQSKKQWSDRTIEEKVEDLKDSVNRLFDYTAKQILPPTVVHYCDHKYIFSHTIEPDYNVTAPQRQSVYICEKCLDQRVVSNYI